MPHALEPQLSQAQKEMTPARYADVIQEVIYTSSF